MVSTEPNGASQWDGVERRADGGKPSRISIVLGREMSRYKGRNTVAQEEAPAAAEIAHDELSANDADATHEHDL